MAAMKKKYRAPKSRPMQFIVRLVSQAARHDIGRNSAALAYYLLFTIFPFLIFLSSLVGLLDLDLNAITMSLTRLLPTEVSALIESYLRYVTENSSATILWFSLVFSIYFPMRAANCLMRSVRRAYHLPRPKNPFLYMLKVLMYTVFLLMLVALTLVLMTMGRTAMIFIGQFVNITPGFVEIWSYFRFLALGVVVLAAVGILYAMARDGRNSVKSITPGALFSLTAWMILSSLYAYYVEHFSNYSVVYGALGTVIVLLIWLYLTSVVLILGAEVNNTLDYMRERRQKGAEDAPGRELPQDRDPDTPPIN